jgi:hypothetical protein
MASHGSVDNANSMPLWAANQLGQTPNTANRTALFGNGTAVGLFGIDAAEAAAQQSKLAHAGIILRKVGTGGRAGRVLTEVLVASGSFTSDDVALPDLTIIVDTHPASKSVNTNLATTFSTVARTAPAGGSIAYLWQANTGSGFANLANAGVYSNTETTTLSISNTAGLTGVQYRVQLTATGATNVATNAATLTVV